MSARTLLPACVLPGCKEPVITVGDACPGCIEAFGPMLVQRTGGEPITADQIEARDAEVRGAYVAMRATGAGADDERKQNQQCWLCEERRSCTRVDGRWECDRCKAVTA